MTPLIIVPSIISIDGGTESLGITAGEAKNPSTNMPRVVKFVFWRRVRAACEPTTYWHNSEFSSSTSLLCSWLVLMVRTRICRLVARIIANITMIVPYTYPNLSSQSTVTSPFTIVFQEVVSGEKCASSAWASLVTSYCSWRCIVHEYGCLHFRALCCQPCAICRYSSFTWYDTTSLFR